MSSKPRVIGLVAFGRKQARTEDTLHQKQKQKRAKRRARNPKYRDA